MSVRVYCPICKGGDNVIWKGSLAKWTIELAKPESSEWYNYSLRHEKAHNHQIMVEYPTRVVPLRIGEAEYTVN